MRWMRWMLALWALLSVGLLQAAAVPPVPEVAARSYILLDFYSGAVLAQREPDQRVEPASLTKLMTAYLTFKAVKEGRLKLDDTPAFSMRGWKVGGSLMFIDPKKPAKVSELIHGMIVVSGNDASVTLAEAIAGSEDGFAQMMNQEATRLGMKNSHFMNATGLPDPQHYSSARDMSILAAAIIRDFPEFYPIYSEKEYLHNNIRQPNRNLLLYRDPSVDGMKTGHTDAAGFCLVASSHREGRRLISVVMGTASPEARAVESAKLLGYGMQFFDTPKLYSKGQVLSTLEVFKGTGKTVNMVVPRDVYLTLPRGEAKQIQAEIQSQKPVLAPIAPAQNLGELTLKYQGQAWLKIPLVAAQAVPEAGFFGRSWDRVRLLWH